MRTAHAVLTAAGLLLATAQGATASPCQAFVESVPGVLIASLDTFPVAAEAPDIDISFVAHSSFRIESASGVVAITDYFGPLGPGKVPDVATMNHAHSTHYTDTPDPRITHVLKGWGDGASKAIHNIEVGDMVVRNVTTDIRGWGTPEVDGNSIFVFEVGDLCIAHLGHLHHMLDDPDFFQLGTIDVVMAPVDGTYTLSIDDMAALLKRLKARIVLPMHWFGPGSLAMFAERMEEHYDVRWHDGPVLTISKDRMPATPQVVIMEPVRFHSLD